MCHFHFQETLVYILFSVESGSVGDDEIFRVLFGAFVNHLCNYADCITSLSGPPVFPAAAEWTSNVSILCSSTVHFPKYGSIKWHHSCLLGAVMGGGARDASGPLYSSDEVLVILWQLHHWRHSEWTIIPICIHITDRRFHRVLMETSGRQRGAARKRRCRLFDLHTKQNISLRGWTEAGRCLELRQYSLQFTLNKEANKVCFQCIYSQTKTNGYGYNMFFTKVLCPAFTIMCTYTNKNHVFAPLPFF